MSPIVKGHPSPALRWAGLLLGLSFGGFFDGILLHQVLQWHHVLSNVQLAAVQDLRVQLLADGLFHLLMYLLAGYALVLLWQTREQLPQPGVDRLLVALSLVGFGGWHVIDGVLAHWVLGLHRIRADATNPLFWDLLWLVVFGLVPLALGWLVWRGGHPGGHGRGARRSPSLARAAMEGRPQR